MKLSATDVNSGMMQYPWEIGSEPAGRVGQGEAGSVGQGRLPEDKTCLFWFLAIERLDLFLGLPFLSIIA